MCISISDTSHQGVDSKLHLPVIHGTYRENHHLVVAWHTPTGAKALLPVCIRPENAIKMLGPSSKIIIINVCWMSEHLKHALKYCWTDETKTDDGVAQIWTEIIMRLSTLSLKYFSPLNHYTCLLYTSPSPRDRQYFRPSPGSLFACIGALVDLWHGFGPNNYLHYVCNA